MGILLIFAVYGAVMDWRYQRRGGTKPSKHNWAMFGIALMLVAVLYITLYLLGASPFRIGEQIVFVSLLLFILWEMGRWRVRRKNPIPKRPIS